VAALFAVMTKVGAYAALRLGTLVFLPETPATDGLYADLLLPAGLITLVVGAVGMLGSRDLSRMAAFAILTSSGTLFVALSAFAPEATAAGLFYLIHSTLAVAALFLLSDVATQPAGRSGLAAALFFAAAIAVAGMPPLSGFLGKLLILEARWEDAAVVWPTILLTSLITMVALARLGSDLFWKAPSSEPPVLAPLIAPALLLIALAALTIWAGPASDALSRISESLHLQSPYLTAIEALR
jgi:multicomponent K+:H+ antiporter subunit D